MNVVVPLAAFRRVLVSLSVALLLVAVGLPLAHPEATAASTYDPIGSFAVSEGSGVVASRQYPGVLWAHRDSGSGTRNVLYAFKVEDGRLVDIVPGERFRTVSLPLLSNRDWEDIAIDDAGQIWLGDIGNNSKQRDDLAVHRIAEPDPYTASEAQVLATYPYVYPDRPSCDGCTGWNAESLVVVDGTPYIVSKARTPVLYRLATRSITSDNVLERVGEITPPDGGFDQLTTAVDVSRDRSRLVLTTAAHHLWVYTTTSTGLRGDELMRDLIGRPPAFQQRYREDGSNEQVEGAAYVGSGRDVLLLSEGGNILHFPAAFVESFDSASTSGLSRPSGPLAPRSGALFGLYAKPRDGAYTMEARMARWDHLESAAGRTFDIGHTFYAWELEFPTWQERWHLDNGRIPMISWNGTFTSQIAAGEHDDHIRARADAVAALGQPVFLRWFWEMDGHKKADWAENPASYVAAWRHIHGIFQARGATNAVWVWCPNAGAFTSGDAPRWYPGDGYVDWVCADAYNWAPGQQDAKWRHLADIFGSFHAWGMDHGKPMMIGETGVQERDPGEKAHWYRTALSQLKDELSGIAAVVYFDSDTIYPWWVDSTQESHTAFNQIVNDPWLDPRNAYDDVVRRLAGSDRIRTAITVSRESYGRDAAEAVVLARADVFADALSAAPLARALEAPLLLTHPDHLPAAVEEEISRVVTSRRTVHLLGGPQAIAPAVEDRLRSMGHRTIRYSGSDRYATAVEVAENGLGHATSLLLATGHDFPDGLVASAAAGLAQGAVLLTDGENLPDVVADYLAAHDDARLLAVGGPAARAVSDAEPIVGVDRYATAVEVASRFASGAPVVGVATGERFPDALVGATHVSGRGGPLLLTPTTSLHHEVQAYLIDRTPDDALAYVYGGSAAIDERVAWDVGAAISGG